MSERMVINIIYDFVIDVINKAMRPAGVLPPFIILILKHGGFESNSVNVPSYFH